jgi:hypothetical protein
MRFRAIIHLTIWLLLAAGAAQSLLASSYIDNISLRKQGQYIELTVYADSNFTFSHFIEEAKAGKPYRIVLDLDDCLHKLPQFNFRELPAGVITAIRTSQYKINPDKVVRIVADLSRPVTYLVKQTEGRVTLVIAAPGEKEFPFWCAQPLSEEDKIELALNQTGQNISTPPQTVSAHPEMEKKATAENKFDFPKPAVETKAAEPKPSEVASTRQTKGEQPPKQMPAETIWPAPADSQALKAKLAQVFEKKPADGKAQLPADAKSKAQLSQPKADLNAQANAPAVPPILAQKPADEKLKNTEDLPAPQKPERGDEPQLESVKKKEFSDSQVMTPPSSDTMEETLPAPVIPKPEGEPHQDQPGTSDSLKGPAPWLPENEFRINPNQPTKAAGTLAAALPKREVVNYRSLGRRDPFMPLVSRAISGYKSGELPDIEALRLVGVLQGLNTSLALLEDLEGYGYILQDGDPVKNGYVIQIFEDKILFQINEYGWSRSVALSLDTED